MAGTKAQDRWHGRFGRLASIGLTQISCSATLGEGKLYCSFCLVPIQLIYPIIIGPDAGLPLCQYGWCSCLLDRFGTIKVMLDCSRRAGASKLRTGTEEVAGGNPFFDRFHGERWDKNCMFVAPVIGKKNMSIIWVCLRWFFMFTSDQPPKQIQHPFLMSCLEFHCVINRGGDNQSNNTDSLS